MHNLLATEQEGTVHLEMTQQHNVNPYITFVQHSNVLAMLIYCFSHALPSTFSVKTFIWASCNRPAEAKRADI